MALSGDHEHLGKQAKLHSLTLENTRSARKNWAVSTGQIAVLKSLTEQLKLSVVLCDLTLLDSKWYVTHGGLMRLARRNRCAGIQVRPIHRFCDPISGRWVFKATAYKSPRSRGFVGYGDADPSNVSSLVHGAEMRVAETRAVNRALRKAYGIGLCSVEEFSRPNDFARDSLDASAAAGGRASSNGQPRLRDRLCQLIRQHQLDPTLVKLYAADYCGTAVLREASRDLVEAFINNLAEWATKDRDGLVCHLSSYAQPKEAKS